ncbi:lipopolysaccharide biosynthesis protein [Martelella alba]|uniref:Lipopolysaccharide biosynthesis protein n=1 Tax=Martelella alba TaxID=2590451 RepID=A0ABY2SK69_9HYPH|nr:lipopolysaccharide biosynthesis protein [Martelella alba]TKI05776.1 lipopolysaccharide biosynthesis protein [Martelella alba]
MSNIRNQAIWMFGGTCFNAILQISQLGILARVLPISELGELSIINAILSVAMVLQDMGMSSYLVHRQVLSRKEQSTIFWVNVFIGFCTGGILLILAYPISYFYNIKQLFYYISLSSLNFFIIGALSQYQSHFIKIKKVIILAKIEMLAKFLSFLFIVIFVKITNLGIYCVIIGLFINALIRLFCLIIKSEKSWHPTFEFNVKTCKEAIKYGSFQLGSQTINQLRTQADSFIIGKILGPEILGIYSLAKELVLRPLQLITPVINRLALPRFAENQHSNVELKKIYLKSTFFIVIICAIGYAFVSLFSPTIVSILYGKNHLKVAAILPLMLVFGMLRPMGGLTGSISQANGKTHIEFLWNIWATMIMLVCLITAVTFHNIGAVAISLSVSQLLISVFVHPLFIKPVVGIDFISYIKQWIFVAIAFVLLIYFINYNDLYINLIK